MENSKKQNELIEISKGESALSAGDFFDHQLYNRIKFFEEVVVIVALTLHLLMLFVRPEYGVVNYDPGAQVDYLYNRFTIVSLILAIYFGITRIDLREVSSRAVKILTITSLIILCVVAYMAGISLFIFPLLALAVAKATLILEGINIWIICSGTYILFFAGGIIRNIIRYEHWREALSDAGALLVLCGGSFLVTFRVIIIIVLVAFLVRALVSAKRQLLEREKLSKELAGVSAKLERLRIAQDLHDSVGHSLTSLKLQLEVASKLFSRQPEKAKDSLDKAFNLSQRSLQEVRSAVSFMKVEQFSLSDSLKTLLKELSELEKVQVESDIEVDEEIIEPHRAYQLFRVIQEASTNVLRHSQATKFKLSMRREDESLEVTLEDDGKGFDVDEADSGSGLTGMAERMKSIGGKFSVESNECSGTCIKLVLPLEK